ncbi:MAG: EAL domain-containing protein [Micromonosporaceae bacterium]|nr:EAL domain-containing protein [Micromonosporaceae bacterium]
MLNRIRFNTDFGTGYSSMVYLRDMPIHELKIDRSFVTTMRTDERNHAIVKAMVDLAHNLTLTVVAEGVEDAETLGILAQLGCGLVQGYYVSKPLPVVDLDVWFDRQLEVVPSG